MTVNAKLHLARLSSSNLQFCIREASKVFPNRSDSEKSFWFMVQNVKLLPTDLISVNLHRSKLHDMNAQYSNALDSKLHSVNVQFSYRSNLMVFPEKSSFWKFRLLSFFIY